jgi:hypothetical protein
MPETNPKPKLEVSYNEALVVALTDAQRIVSLLRIDLEVVYCHPAWKKMESVGAYLKQRQCEEVDAFLADPDTQPRSITLNDQLRASLAATEVR